MEELHGEALHRAPDLCVYSGTLFWPLSRLMSHNILQLQRNLAFRATRWTYLPPYPSLTFLSRLLAALLISHTEVVQLVAILP